MGNTLFFTAKKQTVKPPGAWLPCFAQSAFWLRPVSIQAFFRTRQFCVSAE